MSDKDKTIPAQPKNIPKDGQVIMSIMREMGMTDYEPKTVVQLTEFIYRYSTSILEEAQMYAKNSKKKLDVDDVRLALQLTSEATFSTPPPREVVLECANIKNYTPLPLVKPHCGLRLPPDRYCLASCNYALKSNQKKNQKVTYLPGSPGPTMKIAAKTNVSYVKRSPIGVAKQTVTIAKPLTKLPPNASPQQQKLPVKPKIQISSQTVHMASASTSNGIPMEIDNLLKRKRDDDDEMM